jgi:hypothetical protein
VGGEEDELVVEGSRSLLFSKSTPDSFFFLGKKASTSESSQIIDGDAGSLPVGGNLVRGRRLGRAAAASCLGHLRGGRASVGVASGAWAGTYRAVLEEDEEAVYAREVKARSFVTGGYRSPFIGGVKLKRYASFSHEINSPNGKIGSRQERNP